MIPIAKPYLTEAEADAAANAVLSGWVAQGPQVREFEKKFAEYSGANHAVAVSNCTTALHLSMIVSGIGPGDEVICPSMSYVASSNSIIHAGATPVFAEVRASDFNLDPSDVIRRITGKTKAVLLVHQIGMPADIDAFRKIADEHKLKLIEDAACAAGSSYKGKKIGSHSELVCFSFHPRKVITTGEGGMITTSDDELRKRLTLLRSHAMRVSALERHDTSTVKDEDHTEIGYNYRMTDIQAAIGIRQLEKLDELVRERRRIAEKYRDGLSGIKGISFQKEAEGLVSNYQSFAVVLNDEANAGRDELMSRLAARGISTRKGIMTAHRQSAYESIIGKVSLPVTEKASDTSLLLPIYFPMPDSEVSAVIGAMKESLM